MVYDDGISLVFRPAQAAGASTTVTFAGSGEGRDREVAKTQTRDLPVTKIKPKTQELTNDVFTQSVE